MVSLGLIGSGQWLCRNRRRRRTGIVALVSAVSIFGPVSPALAWSSTWGGILYEDWDACADLQIRIDNESALLYTNTKASYLTQNSAWGGHCNMEAETGTPGEVQTKGDVYVWNPWQKRWELCYAGEWIYSFPPNGLAYQSYWWNGEPPCGMGYYLLDGASYIWTSDSQGGYNWYGGWRNTAYAWFD